MDRERTDVINQWLHPYAPSLKLKEPSHPGEEEKLINISLGYEVLALCLGLGKLCVNLSWQIWVLVLPPREDLRTLLVLFTVNHVYTFETLGKELGKEQKTLCIMLLKWLKRLLTLWWNITMIKDFLAGLTREWHPPVLESSWINRVGVNNGTSGNLLPAPKLGSWTGHFTETSRGHSNYFFHFNQSYFIHACVPLPFVIAIEDLQFNKTLHSVTCINCQFGVTPVHFNHSAYNWEQIR